MLREFTSSADGTLARLSLHRKGAHVLQHNYEAYLARDMKS